MKTPPLPQDEKRCLKVLCQREVLDSAPEKALNDLTALGAHIDMAPIAYIVLDILLPLMDGYTVARQWWSDPALRNISIITVTTGTMVGNREKSLAAGGNGRLEKLINPDTFVTEIERFLPPNRKEGQYDSSPDSG